MVAKDLERRRIYMKEYRRQHQKERNRAYVMSNKKLWMQIIALLGNECVWCGFNDWRALQIDHIKGGGRKEMREFSSMGQYYKHVLRKIQRGSKDYQCLCANCNRIKILVFKENSKARQKERC